MTASNKELSLADFNYDLPEELIARFPCKVRSHSRLLGVNVGTHTLTHHQFFELPQLLQPGDLLVANNTKVIPARLFGRKESGGQVELLVERILDLEHMITYIKASKAPRVDQRIILDKRIASRTSSPRNDDGLNCYELKVIDRQHDQFHLQLQNANSLWEVLSDIGHIPLPPYLQREDEALDQDRYQTVYAQQQGAVAAPTAGLHFDEALLHTLKQQGIHIEYLTLHVGAGTFQPVRVDNITEHHMHAEHIHVPPQVCDAITRTKQQGGRVIAVGTTTVRSLETAARSGTLAPYEGDTRLFIYPGFEFHCIDGMITNFHLPKSSLLMLVTAFAGMELTRQAYQTAITERYRFYSYGDAMLVVK